MNPIIDRSNTRRGLVKQLSLDIVQPMAGQTAIKTHEQCRRKFFWNLKAGLHPIGYKAPLEVGRWGHLYLNCRFKQLSDEDAMKQVAMQYATTRELVIEGLSRKGSAITDESVLYNMERDYNKAIIAARYFWQQKGIRDWTYVEPIAVEKEFKVSVPVSDSVSVPLRGRIDIVLKVTPKGKPPHYVIVDHKFTGRAADYEAVAPFSLQGAVYRILVASLFRDAPVTAFIYNLITPPTIVHKQWQTLDQYEQEIHDWYECRQSVERNDKGKPLWDHRSNVKRFDRAAGGYPAFEAIPIEFDMDAPALTAEMKLRLYEFHKSACAPSDLALYPKTGEGSGACSSPVFGRCAYLPLCAADNDPALVEDILATRFLSAASAADIDFEELELSPSLL